MVDQSRQLQGVLCALALGIGVSLPCAFVLGIHPNLSLLLNANAQNLKQTLNLAGVVHHTFYSQFRMKLN